MGKCSGLDCGQIHLPWEYATSPLVCTVREVNGAECGSRLSKAVKNEQQETLVTGAANSRSLKSGTKRLLKSYSGIKVYKLRKKRNKPYREGLKHSKIKIKV